VSSPSDQREDRSRSFGQDRYTRHEVAAPRAVGLSGRTCLLGSLPGYPPPGGGVGDNSIFSMTYVKRLSSNSSFQMGYGQIRLSKGVSGLNGKAPGGGLFLGLFIGYRIG
jgi:hypothetical protein